MPQQRSTNAPASSTVSASASGAGRAARRASAARDVKAPTTEGNYVEKVRENRALQAFLAGVSAAVVGVIAVVSLDLIPEALVDWPAVGIAIAAFVLIAFLKRDVALVAIGAMLGGVVYATIRALA